MGKDVMNVVFLGLGGNIGNRLENLDKIREAIKSQCGEISKNSGIYETDAWGSESSNKYLNQVVRLLTPLSPEKLLEKLLKIEHTLGRVRSAQQNSDRTADIDILVYNDAVILGEDIQIPHPRLHLRKFVLTPLCEIAPALIHPVLKKSIAALLDACNDTLQVKKINAG